jgi:hypothetical protein
VGGAAPRGRCSARRAHLAWVVMISLLQGAHHALERQTNASGIAE